MYLAQLKLWNFRKFGSATFDIKKPSLIVDFQSGLNLLVGENDSGKTAIIDAIKYTLLTNSREYIRIAIGDFYIKPETEQEEQRAKKLRIECHFKFHEDDNGGKAKNFLEWGHFNKDGEYELRVFLEVERDGRRIKPYEIRGGADDEGTVIDAKARELLRITYLKPLRDAHTELSQKRGSRLSQVLDSHPAFTEKEDHFLSKTISFANKEITSFFKGEKSHHDELLLKIQGIVSNPKEKEKLKDVFDEYLNDSTPKGKEVANQIDEYLESFFGRQTSSKFKIAETSLKNILERLSLRLEQENAGLGSHNLLFIAVELILLEKNDNFTGLRLALIEEIEAHLHPQAQMRLVEYLQKECQEEGFQMLLTTHSPNLASKIKLKNLIICQGTKAYPMGSNYTGLEERDYAFLERFLDSTKANLFFARGVILVEGDAENLLLPVIAKIIDRDLTKYGISIVNLGGLTFKYYERIFIQKNTPPVEQMRTPVAVVTDVDAKPWEYYQDADNKATLDNCIELTEDMIKGINEKFTDKFEDLAFEEAISVFENLDKCMEYFRAYLPNDTIRLPNGFKKYVKENVKTREITEEELLVSQKNTQASITKNHSSAQNTNIKGFVNSHWTLEYELGLSCLYKWFYAAVLMARNTDFFDIENKKEYTAIAKSEINQWKRKLKKNHSQIAHEIYWVQMMGRGTNKLSKAIVAQFFAEILIEEWNNGKNQTLKEQILKDPHLKYLVDAIKHATTT